MKTTWYVIDTDSNITAYPTSEEANDHPGMRFAFSDRSSLDMILSENEGLARSILGNMPVEEPENWDKLSTKKAARLIWDGIQPLAAATHSPDKPAKPARKRAQKPKAKAAKKAKAPKRERTAKPKKERAPRDRSTKLVAMLKRKNGATLSELMAEFGWLAHTTRARMSSAGPLQKLGMTVESYKPEGGERTYRIAS